MKTSFISIIAGAAASAALMLFAAPAMAHVDVGVNIGVPGFYVPPPAPVYVQPAPVYVEPRPVYVQPRPVYVQPRPVYIEQEIEYRDRGEWRERHHHGHEWHHDNGWHRGHDRDD